MGIESYNTPGTAKEKNVRQRQIRQNYRTTSSRFPCLPQAPSGPSIMSSFFYGCKTNGDSIEFTDIEQARSSLKPWWARRKEDANGPDKLFPDGKQVEETIILPSVTPKRTFIRRSNAPVKQDHVRLPNIENNYSSNSTSLRTIEHEKEDFKFPVLNNAWIRPRIVRRQESIEIVQQDSKESRTLARFDSRTISKDGLYLPQINVDVNLDD
ncbi:unnamed protein product [Owenia fusiformis]|uniref:Uncharacterized protein n=1 Tax=Owenia fusiformis TaxID=6347 RepID=A0A8J1TRI4_OWEFU|nr:unnamed protein product [Owenia fusiformis]